MYETYTSAACRDNLEEEESLSQRENDDYSVSSQHGDSSVYSSYAGANSMSVDTSIGDHDDQPRGRPADSSVSEAMLEWVSSQYPDMDEAREKTDNGRHGAEGSWIDLEDERRKSMREHPILGDYFAARLPGQKPRWPENASSTFGVRFFQPSEPPSFAEQYTYMKHSHILGLNKMQPLVCSQRDPATFGFLRSLYADTQRRLFDGNVLARTPLEQGSAWFKLRISVHGSIGIDACHLTPSYRSPLWASRHCAVDVAESCETSPESRRIPAVVLRRYVRAEVRRPDADQHWTALLDSLVLHGGSPRRYRTSPDGSKMYRQMRDLHYKLVDRFVPDEEDYPLYESDGAHFIRPDSRLTPDQFLEVYDLQWLLAPFCETARRLFPILETSKERIQTAAHDVWRVMTCGGEDSVFDVLGNYKIPAPHENTQLHALLGQLDRVSNGLESLDAWYKEAARAHQLSLTMYWRLVKAHRLQDALKHLLGRCVSNTVLSSSYKAHLVRYAEYNAQLFIDTHVRMFAVADAMRTWTDAQWMRDSVTGKPTDAQASALIVRNYPDCRFVLPCESEMPDLTPIVGLGNLRYEVNSKPPQPTVRQALLHIFSCKLMNHGWQLRNLPDILLRYMNGYMHRKSKTFVRGFPSIKEIVVLVIRCGLLGNWVEARTRLAFAMRVESEFTFMNVIVKMRGGTTGTLDEALREGQVDTEDVAAAQGPGTGTAPLWAHATHFETWRPSTATEAHAVPQTEGRGARPKSAMRSSRRIVPLIDTLSRWMVQQRLVVFYLLREFYTQLDKTPIDVVLHDNLRWGRFKSVTRACMDRVRFTMSNEGGADMPQSAKQYWRRPLEWTEERAEDQRKLWLHITQTIHVYHEMSKNCFMKLRKGTFSRISLKQMSATRNYIRSSAMPANFIKYMADRTNVLFRLNAGTEDDPVHDIIGEYDRAKANGGQRTKKPKAADFAQSPTAASRIRRMLAQDCEDNEVEDEDDDDEDEGSCVAASTDYTDDDTDVQPESNVGRRGADRASGGHWTRQVAEELDYINLDNEYDEDAWHDSNTTRYENMHPVDGAATATMADLVGTGDAPAEPLQQDNDGDQDVLHDGLPAANAVRAIMRELPADDIDIDLMNMVAEDVARRHQAKMFIETHWLVELFGVGADNLELFKRIYSYYEAYDMPDNAMIRRYAQIYYASERDFNVLRLYMALIAWHGNQAFIVLPRDVRWRQLRALRRRWDIAPDKQMPPDLGWAYFSPSERTWMSASLAVKPSPKLKTDQYPDKDTRFFIKSLQLEDDAERSMRSAHVKTLLQHREREASAAHSLNMLDVSHCMFTNKLYHSSAKCRPTRQTPASGPAVQEWGTRAYGDELVDVYVAPDGRQRARLRPEKRAQYLTTMRAPWRFDSETMDAGGGSELCAMDLVGVVHYMRDRLYTLCVTCGVVAPYTSANMSNEGPTCGSHDPKGRLRANQMFLDRRARAIPLAPADSLAGHLAYQDRDESRVRGCEAGRTSAVVRRYLSHSSSAAPESVSAAAGAQIPTGCVICKRAGIPFKAAAKQSMQPYRFRIRHSEDGRMTIETRMVCTSHANTCQSLLKGSFAGPREFQTAQRRNLGEHTDLESLFAKLQRDSRRRIRKFSKSEYVGSMLHPNANVAGMGQPVRSPNDASGAAE